ncbi:Protein CBG28042 [Caenorhabditis briggsae]|nr:Protein CBG28042 [Caenorhabditis briggsae]CAR99062.1 Protein CBG28042 [Caenorhabditis briggsae]
MGIVYNENIMNCSVYAFQARKTIDEPDFRVMGHLTELGNVKKLSPSLFFEIKFFFYPDRHDTSLMNMICNFLPHEAEAVRIFVSFSAVNAVRNEALNCPFLQELNHPELMRAVRTYFTIATEMGKRPYYAQTNYDNFVRNEDPVHPSFRVLFVRKPPIARENNDVQENVHQKNSCMCNIM